MRAPDLIVNLGDHVSGPLQAAETADVLMQANYVHIRGNHDRQLLDRPVAQMGLSDQAAHKQLKGLHLDWLCQLPPTRQIDGGVLLCHGSPSNDLQYLLEEVEGDRIRLAARERIQERLGETTAVLVLCGHTHIPRVVSLAGGVCVVNPGSVGLPAYDDTLPVAHYVESGSPHARYAIIDWHPSAPRIELIALEYDWDSAARDAAQAGRPDWACALATGYALRH
jgi:predicted phosphodiesterase